MKKIYKIFDFNKPLTIKELGHLFNELLSNYIDSITLEIEEYDLKEIQYISTNFQIKVEIIENIYKLTK